MFFSLVWFGHLQGYQDSLLTFYTIFGIPPDTVETQSNLSTVVLRNIVETLGFDYSSYEIKEKLLDERLLRNRNRIAHGEYVEVSESEVLELQDECIGLMEIFRNQIDNAVTLRTYRTK